MYRNGIICSMTFQSWWFSLSLYTLIKTTKVCKADTFFPSANKMFSSELFHCGMYPIYIGTLFYFVGNDYFIFLKTKFALSYGSLYVGPWKCVHFPRGVALSRSGPVAQIY